MSVWRDRNVVAALAGGTVNDVGDWLLEIALPVYVYTQTGSGAATAAVYIIQLAVGVVLGPYGGSLADRWNLRTTLIATNALQAVTLLPLLAVDGDRIWPVYVVSAVQAMVAQINNPASFALFPRIVDGELLVQANAAASSGGAVARLIGSPLGGIAVAAGGLSTVVVIDALTFAIGGLAILSIPDRAMRRAPPGDDEPEIDTSVRAGLREVRARPEVMALLAVQAVAFMAFAAFPVFFIVFVDEQLSGDGTEIGLIRGMSAFGGIVAGLVIGKYASRHHPARLMVAGYLLFGVFALGFVNAPSFTTAFWVYLVLFGITGFPNVASQVGQRSTAQRLCPPEVLGRLAGLMSAVSAVGAGIGAGSAALLIDRVPVRVLFNIQGQCFTVCGLIGLFFVLRPLRHTQPVPQSATL
jgi:MFS family permease